METTLIKRTIIFRTYMLKVLITLAILLSNCTCDKSFNLIDNDQTDSNQMVVYPNSGNVFYRVNYKSLTVERTTKLNIPDSIGCFGMCLSTNKDFLIFAGELLMPPFNQFIISYDIKQDTLYNIFSTGLDSVGAPRIIAAHLSSDPGLIYLYSHNVGLYSINFLSQEVNLISGENGIPKEFYYSPNKKWIVIRKYFPGYNNDYTEIEFYNTQNGVFQTDFVLNKNDLDSLDLLDLVFSDDNTQLFISYLLSQRRAVYKAAFFGSYNLVTRKLDSSHVTLPWSVNPYYMAHSSIRNEAYMVGGTDKFYVIDTSTKDYQLKAVVDLTGKVPGPSRIILDPDENICFVSCSRSDFVLVLDLDKRKIRGRIQMERPYLMILL
jgi:hypothetical protein